jgi:ribosomal protein S18 acetylase RimI-like enzyme
VVHSVRRAEARDSSFVERTLTGAFGGTAAAGHDELIDVAETDAVIAERDGRPAGLLTYRDDGRGGWEVVTIVAAERGVGAGAALLDWVRDEARRRGARRVWLVTTNDNTHALRFYQRNGFDLVRLDRGAVDRARVLKPGIPLENDGIPMRHELELELLLG